MFLYIDTLKTNSNELLKAVKINLMPKVPSVPSVPSAPKAPAAPSAGAATGGGEAGSSSGAGISARVVGVGRETVNPKFAAHHAKAGAQFDAKMNRPKSVDCPLGADCPDGGKHRPDSKVFQKHTAAAQKRGLASSTSEKKPEEEVGKKEEVEAPEAQNLGSLGSDKAELPETKPTEEAAAEPEAPDAVKDVVADADKTEVMPTEPAAAKPKAKSKAKLVTKKYDAARDAAIDASVGAHSGEISHEEAAAAHLAAAAQATPGSKIHQQHLEHAKMHGEGKNPYQKELDDAALGQAGTEVSPASVEGPLDEAKTEVTPPEDDSKTEVTPPEDDSKTEVTPPEDDSKTEVEPPVDESEVEGPLDESKTEVTPPEDERNTEQKLSQSASEQKDRAKKLLQEAKAKHQETSEKAKKIKESNQKKLDEYKQAQDKYDADKEAGKKKLKKPKKPALDKEISVPDKPEIYEPESNSEKLRHQDHTSRANKLASDAESHLLYNTDLSDSDRKKLEQAHAIGSFHANIEHHPSAAMKAEVAEAEKIVRRFGKPRTPADTKTQISPPPDFDETELDEGDIEDITGQTEISPPPEGTEEDEAEDSKAKTQIGTPPEDMEGPKPTSDIEHLRVQSHKDKAGSLRDKINSHLESNPDLSDADRKRAQLVLSALDKHHGLETTPTKEQTQELNELAKHAGDLGKKEFKPKPPKEEKDTADTEAPKRKDLSAFNYLVAKMREGAARGKAIGRAAASPGGAASVASQTLNYGVSGAVGTGHRLLSDTDRASYQQKVDEYKEAKEAEKEAKEAEKDAGKTNETSEENADLSAADLSAERAAVEDKINTNKSLVTANSLHLQTLLKAKELLARHKGAGSQFY